MISYSLDTSSNICFVLILYPHILGSEDAAKYTILFGDETRCLLSYLHNMVFISDFGFLLFFSLVALLIIQGDLYYDIRGQLFYGAIFVYVTLQRYQQKYDSTIHIKNTMTHDECMDSIKWAKSNAPKMTLQMKFYDLEETKLTLEGCKTIRNYTDEINEPFPFTNWVDESPSVEALDYVDVLHITRLETDKMFIMSPKCQENYEN